MRLELPSKEVTEAEIVILNRELADLEEEARSLGLKPVTLDEIPYPDDEFTSIQPTTTAAGFWNHHIGAPLDTVVVQLELLERTGKVDEEVVKAFQGRTLRLINNWINDDVAREDPLNLQTSNAFLRSAFAFYWLKNPSITRRLQENVGNLGDFYAIREGHQPLSFHGIINGTGAPSRAYLKCTDPKNVYGI